MGDVIDIDKGELRDLDCDDLEMDDEAIGDDEAILAHPLVLAFQDPSTSTIDRLRLIQVAMARCAAELAFQNEHPGYFEQPEAGRAVSRRVRALKRIAEVEVAEARSCGPRHAQVDHPDVSKLLDLLLQRVVGVAHEVLPSDRAEVIERQLREELAADPGIPWPPSS